ncbi:GMC oxidoreductase-domain-containing protein [Mycena epipterygia]|nr:GMC oxidoreductase-domain-containing protein [Mycena epipterygia]
MIVDTLVSSVFPGSISIFKSVNSGPWVNQTFPEFPYKGRHKSVRSKSESSINDFCLQGQERRNCSRTSSYQRSELPSGSRGCLRYIGHRNRRKYARVSSYHAFLPVKVAQDRRDHLKICTSAVATRVDLDAGVAVGVVFEFNDESIDQTFYARARKEIVVCCGALGSPQLLLLSGIGRKEDLKEHGIDIVVFPRLASICKTLFYRSCTRFPSRTPCTTSRTAPGKVLSSSGNTSLPAWA